MSEFSTVYFDRWRDYLISTAWLDAGFDIHEMRLEVIAIKFDRGIEVELELRDPREEAWVMTFDRVRAASWDSEEEYAADRPPEAAGEIVAGEWYEPSVFDIQTIDGQLLINASGARTARATPVVSTMNGSSGPDGSQRRAGRGCSGTHAGHVHPGDAAGSLGASVWSHAGLELEDMTLQSMRIRLDSEFHVSLGLRDPADSLWALEFEEVLSMAWEPEGDLSFAVPPEGAVTLTGGTWIPPNRFDVETSAGKLAVAAAGAVTGLDPLRASS